MSRDLRTPRSPKVTEISSFTVRAARRKGKMERRREKDKVERAMEAVNSKLAAERAERRNKRLPRKEEYTVTARPRNDRGAARVKVAETNGGAKSERSYSFSQENEPTFAQAKVMGRLQATFFDMDMVPKYRNFTNINGRRKKQRNSQQEIAVKNVITQMKSLTSTCSARLDNLHCSQKLLYI